MKKKQFFNKLHLLCPPLPLCSSFNNHFELLPLGGSTGPQIRKHMKNIYSSCDYYFL